MNGLHWFFYNFGVVAALLSACLMAMLAMWTLRGARRSAIYKCAVALVICLAVLAVCVVGMELT